MLLISQRCTHLFSVKYCRLHRLSIVADVLSSDVLLLPPFSKVSNGSLHQVIDASVSTLPPRSVHMTGDNARYIFFHTALTVHHYVL